MNFNPRINLPPETRKNPVYLLRKTRRFRCQVDVHADLSAGIARCILFKKPGGTDWDVVPITQVYQLLFVGPFQKPWV
jgi:hypothetical protein